MTTWGVQKLPSAMGFQISRKASQYIERNGPELVTGVVYHLQKDSSISEWKINGTYIFGRPNWKITGINGLLENCVLFDWFHNF